MGPGGLEPPPLTIERTGSGIENMNEPHDDVEGREHRLKRLIGTLQRVAAGLREVSQAPTNEPHRNEVPVLRLKQGDYQRDYFFEDDNR
jgi:hypothetical protein